MQAHIGRYESTRKVIIAETITGIVLILAMIPLAVFYTEFQAILIVASPVLLTWIFNAVGYLGIQKKSPLLIKIWLGYDLISIYYTMIVGLLTPLLLLMGRGLHCEKERHDPICASTLHSSFPLLALIYFFITYMFRVVLLFMGCQLNLPISESAFAEAGAEHPSLIDLFRMPPLLLLHFKLPWATQLQVTITFNLIALTSWVLASMVPRANYDGILVIFYLIGSFIFLIGPSLLALVGATYRQPVALILYVLYCLTPLHFLFVGMMSGWLLDLAFLVIFVSVTCITVYQALRLYYMLQVKPLPDDQIYAII